MRRVVLVVALLAAFGCSDGGRGEAVTGDVSSPPPESTAAPMIEPTTTTTTTTPLPPQPPQPWAGPPQPADPAAAAATVTNAERALRDPATPSGEIANLAIVHQAAYRAVSQRPDWVAPFLAAVPPDLRPAADAIVTAGALLLTKVVKPQPALPRWQIVAPPPPATLVEHYRAAESSTAVPWTVLAAIHLVETRMGRIRGTSTAGAEGPMQFLPSTWKVYGKGGDINSHADSIMAAGRLLAANGFASDRRRAIWHYNHSYAYVDAVLAYAGVIEADERAYVGFHGWQVYYRLTTGDVILPEGWVGTS